MIPLQDGTSTQTHTHVSDAGIASANSKASPKPRMPVMCSVQNARRHHPVLRRSQTLPAKYIQEILSDEQGPLSRDQLLAYANSELSVQEIRRIPRTWPTELISAHDVMLWSDAIVRTHQSVYTNYGEQSYVEAVMAVVFPTDQMKAPNLPDKLMHFCVMLDTQAIMQCRHIHFSSQELESVRLRIQAGFVFGRILFPHLRPYTLRNTLPYQSMQLIDHFMVSVASRQLIRFFKQVMQIAEQAVLAEESEKQVAILSVPQQIARLIGAQYGKNIHADKINDFHQVAAHYLHADIHDKAVLIRCIHILFSLQPVKCNQMHREKMDAAVRFIYSSRHRIDMLTVEAKRYFMRHLVLISMPERKESLQRQHLKEALAHAERMLPSFAEEEEGASQ